MALIFADLPFHGPCRVGAKTQEQVPCNPDEWTVNMLQQPRNLGGNGGVGNGAPRHLPGRYEAQCVLLDQDGHATYTTMRKAHLVSELSLRHRDVRALEPGVALPYPAAIFVRKQALVLNLEGLKVIISKDKAFIISVPHSDNLSIRMKPTLDSPTVCRLATMIAFSSSDLSQGFDGFDGGGSTLISPASLANLKVLEESRTVPPFELRTLDGALGVATSALAREVAALEGRTNPLLAGIRRRVDKNDLEMLFEVQVHLEKAIGRVGRIKEVLEELLDDESEMAGMCLSRSQAAVELSGNDVKLANDESCPLPAEEGCQVVAMDMGFEEISELEDMIEAYWLQVDSLLSRLKSLQDRISSTRHLVNLDLDSKRNSLVALGLVIDVILMAFETHMMVTSIFGMNLTSGLEPYQPWSLWGIVTFGGVIGACAAVLTLRYVRSRGLLFLPSFGLAPSV